MFRADLGPSTFLGALTWDENTSTLLAVQTLVAGVDTLNSVDTSTGAQTLLHSFANSDWDINGAAFDARSDTLWLTADLTSAGPSVLLSLDLAGGPPFSPATVVGTITGETQIEGLVWDPGRGALIAVASAGGDRLLEIDPSTAAPTLIGATSVRFQSLLIEP